MRKEVDFGFGVSIETIESDSAKIHNLKSDKENVLKSGDFRCASCLDRFDKNIKCPHCNSGKMECLNLNNEGGK